MTAYLNGSAVVRDGSLFLPMMGSPHACLSGLATVEGAASFAVWAFAASAQPAARFFDLSPGTAGASGCNAPDPTNFFAAYRDGVTTNLRVQTRYQATATLDASAVLQLSAWQLLVVTIAQSGVWSIYVGNFLVKQQWVGVWPRNQTNYAAYLGRSQTTTDQYFYGLISSFSYYTYELSPGHVRARSPSPLRCCCVALPQLRRPAWEPLSFLVSL